MMPISGRPCVAPPAPSGPISVSLASSLPAARSRPASTVRSARSARTIALLNLRLTGGDHDLALGQRHVEPAIAEGQLHAVAYASGVDRQALIDIADDGVEGRRIETRDASILQREGAAALKRADQRDWAAAGAFKVEIERELASERRTGDGYEVADIGRRQSDAAGRGQSIGAAAEGYAAGDTATRECAVDLIECYVRLIETEHAAQILRSQCRRQRDARRTSP